MVGKQHDEQRGCREGVERMRDGNMGDTMTKIQHINVKNCQTIKRVRYLECRDNLNIMKSENIK